MSATRTHIAAARKELLRQARHHAALIAIAAAKALAQTPMAEELLRLAGRAEGEESAK
jgi:hypothetical protein